MRVVGVVIVGCAAIAHAEEPPPADEPTGELGGITLRAERYTDPDEPLLHLDHDLSVASQSLGAEEHHDGSVLELGRVRLAIGGEWWKSSLTPKLFGPDIDEVAHGWRASYELSLDLELFRLGASVSYGHVDGRDQRGTYRMLGISATRTFRLSRWMHGWISLGFGQRVWLGAEPPPGEPRNANTLMLSIGTTFR